MSRISGPVLCWKSRYLTQSVLWASISLLCFSISFAKKEKALNLWNFNKWKDICKCRLLQFTCANHCWKSLWITLEIGFQLLLLPTYILPHSAEIRKVIIHVPFVRRCCYCIFTLQWLYFNLRLSNSLLHCLQSSSLTLLDCSVVLYECCLCKCFPQKLLLHANTTNMINQKPFFMNWAFYSIRN